MKRFLLMIVAVCAFLAASAQHPMVTLSRNGELKFFSNLTALNTAVDSAQNGDVLYLSEGAFVLNNGKLEIPVNKRLSIVGSGYKSHLLGSVTVNTGNTTLDSDAPLFDGVKMDKLSFSSNTAFIYQYQGSSEIRRCWIKDLSSGANCGKDINYVNCFIERADFEGFGTVEVNNSKIKIVGGAGFAKYVNVLNCNIDSTQYYPNTMISSILNSKGTKLLNIASTYRILNSILRNKPLSQGSATVMTDGCLFWDEIDSYFDENLELIDPTNPKWTEITGLDGTVVGIYGGEYPFTENPSVPSVDTADSSVEYDAAGNKLKVSITVKAD